MFGKPIFPSEKKQPMADRGRSLLNTEPGTSLGQPKAAPELYPGWIETYSGIQWNCMNPRREDVNMTDIAHGLSLMCRFGGQVREFYSVAQHSIYVFIELATRFPGDYLLQLHGLLHDASEAYLSDVVRPFKQQIPLYLEVEERTQNVILDALGLPPLTPTGKKSVKSVDNALLATEHRDLYSHSKFDWTLPEPPVWRPVIPISDWRVVEEIFLDAYNRTRTVYDNRD